MAPDADGDPELAGTPDADAVVDGDPELAGTLEAVAEADPLPLAGTVGSYDKSPETVERLPMGGTTWY
jgi:hypothetical protein